MGAATLSEAGIVPRSSIGPAGASMLARLIQESAAQLLPFDAWHGSIAVDAFACFGKGGRAAALNVGDCQCYAVAVPDRRTDIVPA